MLWLVQHSALAFRSITADHMLPILRQGRLLSETCPAGLLASLLIRIRNRPCVWHCRPVSNTLRENGQHPIFVPPRHCWQPWPECIRFIMEGKGLLPLPPESISRLLHSVML